MEQIITGEGQIVPDLDEHITRSGIDQAGTDYHMVSIIGCQSSGKSTLLNLLFGTKFETMNEQKGRQQTTKGIHAARAVNGPILLFDVEGSDSRERGDSDALFERKSSLFALALSELLVINMWESDIGRYNAANIPMLKTVMEVNVQLFLAQSTSKSKILFVIRDSTIPNFDVIKFQINRDMENIWAEITLPDSLKDKTIHDFFDFDFYAIHHMVIQRDIFDKDISALRQRFIDEKEENYLFKEKSTKVVPGGGLSTYIRNLWEVINENKELNIPSQKLMLSRFKCEENAKAAYDQFKEKVTKTILEPMADESVNLGDKFKSNAEEAIKAANKFYHDNSWRYQQAAVEEFQQKLSTDIGDLLISYYIKHCNYYARQVMQEFTKFISGLPDSFEKGGKWAIEVQAKIDELSLRLDSTCRDSLIEGYKWQFPSFKTIKAMDDARKSYEEIMTKKLYKNIFAEEKIAFDDKASELLMIADQNMWENLRKLIEASAKVTDDRFMEIIKTNVLNPKPQEGTLKRFQRHALNIVKESANYIMMKMKTAFDRSFRYEKNGRPRVWTRRHNLNQIYEESRASGRKVLILFTYCRLASPDDQTPNNPLNQVLIPVEKSQEIEEKFEKLIIHAYEEARASVLASQNNEHIPPWAWFLFLFSCSDYILWWLSNPLLFSLTVLFGGTYLVLNQLGLWDTAVQKLLDIIKKKIVELGATPDENNETETNQTIPVEESQITPPPPTETTTDDGPVMKRRVHRSKAQGLTKTESNVTFANVSNANDEQSLTKNNTEDSLNTGSSSSGQRHRKRVRVGTLV
ncbi:hypothetical protein TVAG_273580 [Trichomonas vaginalis G3]|uniref:Protein SEY1 homolog 1 n=1 Tax=Trichomonas vaginalis (strain ATCC PRA-98 / G3) TaxID=412133 RepID=SEY11_TRIV3|nr:SEY1 family [Trichomonas vaginalis G3]A2EI35.1 RecName: Full=Protein SEY1 homolog 1 [Trichomonas vaginalis G3]EAY07674.1 hypothetical protein TVAG_273580 [Trichomonas vaginalis G3]KAI5518525.1 SEY1 family [Trichomonas vaginalis G3]|eukprot:XP_001319897.1 hypothetical protein [Trichomonas vaginalis G3]